jgi:hypothetical protein
MHASGVTRVGVSRQVCAAATKNPSVRPCALPSAPSHRYQQLPPRASAAEGRPLRFVSGLDSAKKLRWNVAKATSEGEVQSSSVDELSIPKGTTWELDFCSRPLVDEKGKKVRRTTPSSNHQTSSIASVVTGVLIALKISIRSPGVLTLLNRDLSPLTRGYFPWRPSYRFSHFFRVSLPVTSRL